MNRIVIKLGGSIILLFLVVLLPLGFVINQIFTGFYYNTVQENIDQLADRYAQTIASSDAPLMAVSMIEMMNQYSDNKLYIIDSDGTVIANSSVSWKSKGSNQKII
jgi:hypothetical protein